MRTRRSKPIDADPASGLAVYGEDLSLRRASRGELRSLPPKTLEKLVAHKRRLLAELQRGREVVIELPAVISEEE